MRPLLAAFAATLLSSCVSAVIQAPTPQEKAALQFDRARVHYNRAWGYQGLGFPLNPSLLTQDALSELSIAVAAANEVARLTPESGGPHAFLAAVYLNAFRDPKHALVEISLAIELGDLGKMGAESYSMRAMLYRDFGQEKLYREALAEAEAKFPGHYFVEQARDYQAHDSAFRGPASSPLAHGAPALLDARADGSLSCSSGWTTQATNGEISEERYKLDIKYVPEDKFHQIDLAVTKNGKTENNHYAGFCFFGSAKPGQRLAPDLAVTFVCLDSELDWLGTSGEDSYSALLDHTFLSSRVRAGTDFGTSGTASQSNLLGTSFAWLRILTKKDGKEVVLTEMSPENCTAK